MAEQANLNFMRDTFETIEPTVRVKKRAPANWEELIYPNFVPADTESVAHYTIDHTGKPKEITGKAGEKLPTVDITTRKDKIAIRDFGFSLEFDLRDVKAAIAGDVSTMEHKTNAAFSRERRHIYDTVINGGGVQGLTGLANAPTGSDEGQIQTVAVTGNKWDASGITPNKILDDLNNGWNATADSTDGVSPANTMFISLKALQIARSARLPNSSQTALQAFRESVEDITGEPFLIRQNKSFGNDILFSRYGEDTARIHIAQSLLFGEMQPVDWGFTIPCRYAVSGVELLDSFSFAKLVGVTS